MREPDFRRSPSVVVILIAINLALFVVTAFVSLSEGGQAFLGNWIHLSVDNLLQFKVWTVLTYGFFHASVFHVLINMLALFFVGRILEESLGKERFLALYTGGVLVGALCFVAVRLMAPYIPGSPFSTAAANNLSVIGASAAVFAILTFFCLANMERPMQVLLFFIIPVTVKPKWLLWGLIGLTAFGLLFSEILARTGSVTSHSAHAGGILAGWLYLRFGQSWGIRFDLAKLRRETARVQEPEWAKKKSAVEDTTKNYTVNISDRKGLQSEVDRILDKINAKGFGSLTPEEKKLLEKARHLLSRSGRC